VIGLLILLGGVAGPAAPNTDAKALTCNLELADRSRFQLTGLFDKAGFDTNLSDLIGVEGDFAPAPEEIVITSDGTQSHQWRLDSVRSSQKFVVSLTEYGAQPGLMLVERRRFVGRHWGRSLVGVGLCDIRSSRRGGKES
jgi:hypothetical protein